jgi:hypothetical protein
VHWQKGAYSPSRLDNANNTETTHVSNSFRIDTVAPATTNSAMSGNTYTGAQTFSLTPTDSGSGVASTWYKLDGAASFTSGTSVSVPAPSSGSASHTILWYSIDTAGNQEATHSVTFSVSAASALSSPQTWTTPGTYYFTVPSSVTSLTIDALGGGGQGGIGSYYAGTSHVQRASGGSAVVSYNSQIVANASGGQGGFDAYNDNGGNGGPGGTATGLTSMIRTNGSPGGSGTSGDDQVSGTGGGGGSPNGQPGGDADPSADWAGGGGGGGGGARVQGTLPVTPGSIVSITIGTDSSVTMSW